MLAHTVLIGCRPLILVYPVLVWAIIFVGDSHPCNIVKAIAARNNDIFYMFLFQSTALLYVIVRHVLLFSKNN